MAWKRIWIGLIGVGVFFLSTSILLVAKWISNKFGPVGAEQITYHMVAPLDGIDPRFVYSVGFLLASAAAGSVIYAFFLFRALRGGGVWRIGNRGLGWLVGSALALTVAVSLGYVERRYGIAGFFNPAHYLTREESTFFEENYRRVESAAVTFPDGRNNLIVLILESADVVFNREDLFGEKLMPNLDRVARENISFSRQRQCLGTGWSAAGICCYLLGVPLIAPGGLTKFYGEVARDFLPGAGNIMAVLSDHGYDVDFLIGVDARFGGHDKVLRSHVPKANIVDIRDFEKSRSDTKGNMNDWGLTDSYLFARVRERLAAYSDKKPFALIVETMNAHVPGYPETDNPRRWNDYRDCFPEMDGTAAKFLAWVRQQAFAGDTTIVIVGDHLAMTDAAGPVNLPPFEERSVYNAVLNSRRQPDKPGAERLFGSWDLAPTILESVGARLPERRFGLGVSLFATEPTVLEKFGAAKYESEMGKQSRLYMSFFAGGRQAAGQAGGR